MYGEAWEGDNLLLLKNMNKESLLPLPTRAVIESARNTKPSQYVAGHFSSRKGIVL